MPELDVSQLKNAVGNQLENAVGFEIKPGDLEKAKQKISKIIEEDIEKAKSDLEKKLGTDIKDEMKQGEIKNNLEKNIDSFPEEAPTAPALDAPVAQPKEEGPTAPSEPAEETETPPESQPADKPKIPPEDPDQKKPAVPAESPTEPKPETPAPKGGEYGDLAKQDTGSPKDKKEKPNIPDKKENKPEKKGISKKKGAKNMATSLARNKRDDKLKKKREEEDKEKKTDKKSGEQTEKKPFPLSHFAIWLILALIADLISLIPYVGLIASWPFALAFGIYKWYKKLKFKLLTSALDAAIEAMFSSLPANTADVLATYALNKTKNLDKKSGTLGKIAKMKTKGMGKMAKLAEKVKK